MASAILAGESVEGGATLRARRRTAILDAAESLFLEQGFERTSLANVVGRSRGSLATLYELFGNKQGLLRAIAARWRDEVTDAHAGDGLHEGSCKVEILRRFARWQLAKMGAPRSVALMKIVFSESLRDSDFAAQIYRDLHIPLRRDLADLFRAWNAEGVARIDDPEAAARYFLSLTAGDSVLRKLFGVEEDELGEAEIGWRVGKFAAQFGIA